MHFHLAVRLLFASLSVIPQYGQAFQPRNHQAPGGYGHADVLKPKVFIISMFEPEGSAWYGIPEFDLLSNNITVPGFSTLYPDAHCTANGDICQLVTGEGGMPIHDFHLMSRSSMTRNGIDC